MLILKLFLSSACQIKDNLSKWQCLALLSKLSCGEAQCDNYAEKSDTDYSIAQPFYSKKSLQMRSLRGQRLSHVVSLNGVYDSLSQAYGLSRSSKAAAASNFLRALLTPRPCQTITIIINATFKCFIEKIMHVNMAYT